MKIILSLTFLSLAMSNAFPQADFLVTTNGDTLYGEIKPLGFSNTAYDKVILKVNKKKNTYTSLQAISYYKNKETFETIKHNGRFIYMKLVTKGYLSVYKFRPNESYQYSNILLVKADGNQMELPNIGFKKQMSNFLNDCDEIARKLDEDHYKKKEIEKIVADYNTCIQQNTDKLIEEHAIRVQPNILEIINELRTLSENLEQEKGDELQDLLDDIQERLAEQKNIPGYLKTSLEELTAGDEKASHEARRLLEAMEEI